MGDYFLCRSLRSPRIFFFSSRRRHTRSLCDWSSDVCSSDLEKRDSLMPEVTFLEALRQGMWEEMERDERVFILGEDVGAYGGAFKVTEGFAKRSEERRVGKECRSRWSPYH